MTNSKDFIEELERFPSSLIQVNIKLEKTFQPIFETLQHQLQKMECAELRTTLDSLNNNLNLICEHREVLQFLREDIQIRSVLSVIKKLPKNECDDELLRLFGIPELKKSDEPPLQPLLPLILEFLTKIFNLWSVLLTLGVTNLTFADFLTELSNKPAQAIRIVHDNPALPNRLDEKMRVTELRNKRKKRAKPKSHQLNQRVTEKIGQK